MQISTLLSRVLTRADTDNLDESRQLPGFYHIGPGFFITTTTQKTDVLLLSALN